MRFILVVLLALPNVVNAEESTTKKVAMGAAKGLLKVLRTKRRFAKAVEKNSAINNGALSGDVAIDEETCGGMTGPGCSWFTVVMEVAKIAAPLAADQLLPEKSRLVRDMVLALDQHSVLHDAGGYVYSKTKRGPGYGYAGCALFCDPANPMTGQAMGISTQIIKVLTDQ